MESSLILAGLLSTLIGVSLGLLGGGGSILAVPVLVYALGLEPRSAIATSLLIVGVTSGIGALTRARDRQIQWRTGALFGAAGMIGAQVGGRLARFLPPSVLLIAFALMMLATAAAMIRGRRDERGRAPSFSDSSLPIAKTLGHGALVGLLTGLVGAGGGFLIVPALVLLGGLSMKIAVGTSLLVITMNSAAAFAGYLGHVSIDWPLAWTMTACAVAGSFAGGLFARRLPQQTLRTAFGWFVVAMAIFMLSRQGPAVAHAATHVRDLLGSGWTADALATVGALGLATMALLALQELLPRLSRA